MRIAFQHVNIGCRSVIFAGIGPPGTTEQPGMALFNSDSTGVRLDVEAGYGVALTTLYCRRDGYSADSSIIGFTTLK